MTWERLERRVLGAVRFLDATTGLTVFSPLIVEASGVRTTRNRRGLYVIESAPGLEHHAHSFEKPPAAPALGSVAVELKVSDPARTYLARRAVVKLPLDADPKKKDALLSLFNPQEVELFPSTTAQLAPGWAVIRATVREEGTQKRLPWSLIRVKRKSDGRPLARTQADARGEALVAVPGIPVTTWEEGAGPVLASEVEVIVEVLFDPALRLVEDVTVDPNRTFTPDPDEMERRAAAMKSNTFNRKLQSGVLLAPELSELSVKLA